MDRFSFGSDMAEEPGRDKKSWFNDWLSWVSVSGRLIMMGLNWLVNDELMLGNNLGMLSVVSKDGTGPLGEVMAAAFKAEIVVVGIWTVYLNLLRTRSQLSSYGVHAITAGLGANSAAMGSTLLLLAGEFECPATSPPSGFTGPPLSSLSHRETGLAPLVL
ncbi:hypothetical protein A2U01_0026581, partial [Trifolium medium]|nr:hypothetical protein [Trifolium medium]